MACVRERIPGARLLIAGRVGECVSGDGIDSLGFVESAGDAYAQADVVINPVSEGTGLNIKSIEALGHGVPVVSLPAGARGLEAAVDRGLIVAPTIAAMTTAIEGLRARPEARAALSNAALAFAREWNARTLQQLAAKLA